MFALPLRASLHLLHLSRLVSGSRLQQYQRASLSFTYKNSCHSAHCLLCMWLPHQFPYLKTLLSGRGHLLPCYYSRCERQSPPSNRFSTPGRIPEPSPAHRSRLILAEAIRQRPRTRQRQPHCLSSKAPIPPSSPLHHQPRERRSHTIELATLEHLSTPVAPRPLANVSSCWPSKWNLGSGTASCCSSPSAGCTY